MLPDAISFSIAESLGLKSNINAVIFVWLGFLFVMTYYQSTTIERLEKQMTELIRKVALEKQAKLDLEQELEEANSKSQIAATKVTTETKSKAQVLDA